MIYSLIYLFVRLTRTLRSVIRHLLDAPAGFR